MITEDKELLLKDLCARLPYGVKYRTTGSDFAFTLKWIDKLNRLDGDVRLKNAKIFLRPLSSMTEEEKKELKFLCDIGPETLTDSSWANGEFGLSIIYKNKASIHADVFDWLNKKMFDYRGLIPLGLALEAPEGMYNN